MSELAEGHGIQHSYITREDNIDLEDVDDTRIHSALDNLFFHKAEEDWRMTHHAPSPEYGAPVHDLAQQLGSDDIYQHPEWFHDMTDKHNKESFKVLKNIHHNPEADVHIYRAMPKEYAPKGINKGDWVSLSHDYAKEHGMQDNPNDDWPVVHSVVKAKHLYTDPGTSLSEAGYWGEHA